jgi:tetratricopeptide (TPR) repeat protein
MDHSESAAPATSQTVPEKRLESWKEIAACLNRDVRTVQRWERLEGLPVHRHFHGRQGTVYAFQSEIEAWWQQRRIRLEALDAVVPGQPTEGIAPDPLSHELAATSSAPYPARGSMFRIATLVLVPVAVLAAIWFVRDILVSGPSGTLRGWLNPARASSTLPRPQAQAQALYLQGRYYWNRRTVSGLNSAVDYFTQAIVQDPGFAPAYVGLADCYNLLREYGAMTDQEAFPRALAAARKAVELDDSSSDAHASLAFASYFGSWDSVTAEREFNRAIELDPANGRAHHWHATYYMTLGRFQDALAEIDRAQQLDPSSTAIQTDKALILFYAGRSDEAVRLLRQLEKETPDFLSTHRYLASISLVNHNYSEYLAESGKAAHIVNNEQELALIQAQQSGFDRHGPKGMLEAMFDQQKLQFDKGLLPAYPLAQTCAHMGEKQKALEYLQSAFHNHESAFLIIRIDPAFRDLHATPEYQQLVAQIFPA